MTVQQSLLSNAFHSKCDDTKCPQQLEVKMEKKCDNIKLSMTENLFLYSVYTE